MALEAESAAFLPMQDHYVAWSGGLRRPNPDCMHACMTGETQRLPNGAGLGLVSFETCAADIAAHKRIVCIVGHSRRREWRRPRGNVAIPVLVSCGGHGASENIHIKERAALREQSRPPPAHQVASLVRCSVSHSDRRSEQAFSGLPGSCPPVSRLVCSLPSFKT